MDLNMGQGRMVKHPSEWPHCGYGAIQKAPDRYRLIERKALMELLGMSESDELSLLHRSWVEEALRIKEKGREGRWSERIAVGSLSYVEQVKTELGARGFGRSVFSNAESHELRDLQVSYDGHSASEMGALSHHNTLLYDVNAIE
jgi:putative transposase